MALGVVSCPVFMRGLRAVCLLLALLLSSCGGEPAPTDVVVLLVDTLRADHVGAYGYERDTTPHIDAPAAEVRISDFAPRAFITRTGKVTSFIVYPS